MQTLEFAKKSTSKNKTNQKTEQIGEEINLREVRGISLSRNVFRIVGSDSFFCKSESREIYHFIRYEPYFYWCSCEFNSIKHVKCKHIFAVEYSIRKGTLQDVEKLPKEVKRDNMVSKSYLEDEYSF